MNSPTPPQLNTPLQKVSESPKPADAQKVKKKSAPAETFYITTAIDYVTDLPHIGHAYEKTAADILTRYWRRRGRNVFFLTGTDEHGLKVAQAAQKKGQEVREFVENIALKYKATWSAIEIKYDNFIRTTDPEHEKYVQQFVQKLYDMGEIYKDRYQGLYCVGCEEYKTVSELLPGNTCSVHKTLCQAVFEDVYFFRLSKYQEKILDIIQSGKMLVEPVERRNEIISFLTKQPLQDLAMSRSKVSWGILVPWDTSQTIYVWIDALLNYITGSRGNWPPSLQLIGKDIFRFHCIIWPALLMAMGYELPRKILIHGFLTINGERISKTTGNTIDPLQIVKMYGVDPLRYFLFREVPFGQDGDFSVDRFEKRYKSDLANDLGNLVQRVLTMAVKYNIKWEYKTITKPFHQIDQAIEDLKFDKALELIWDMITESNQKIDLEKPWQLENNPKKLTEIISQLLQTLSQIAFQIDPFMPETSWAIIEQLKSRKAYVIFPRKNK
ncbi:MAG: metG [Candidatus Berkelbacteria bacterium]|nr:metG [Candidatus Berkelbacteria bacterium]